MAVIKPNAAPEKSKRGYIRLTVEELANGSEDDLILEMSATKLKKMVSASTKKDRVAKFATLSEKYDSV